MGSKMIISAAEISPFSAAMVTINYFNHMEKIKLLWKMGGSGEGEEAGKGQRGRERWGVFRCCCLNIILILIFSEEYHFVSLKFDEVTPQKTVKFLQRTGQQRQERKNGLISRNSMMMISGSRVLSTKKSNMGIFRLEILPMNISLNMPGFSQSS